MKLTALGLRRHVAARLTVAIALAAFGTVAANSPASAASDYNNTGTVPWPVRVCADPTTGICVWYGVSTYGWTDLTYTASGSVVTFTNENYGAATAHASDWGLYTGAWIEHYTPSQWNTTTGSTCYVWVQGGWTYFCRSKSVSSKWTLPAPSTWKILGKYTLGSSYCCTYVLPGLGPVQYKAYP